MEKIKAIGLMSGGLDSHLAACLMLEQEIDLYLINYMTPFCTCTAKGKSCSEASKVARELDLPLKVVNITKDFLEVVKDPPHGYGSNMNPCIDCRILYFKRAKEYMAEIDAKFVVTGEVLGERPMSQRLVAMNTIEHASGLDGYVVRPLSAKRLKMSIPEEKGWVDREKFLNIQGRSRKPQIELAEKFQLKDYPCPAGGCLLTDPGFARRAKDLVSHNALTIDNVYLIKTGRYFRLNEKTILAVGRNQDENARLQELAKEKDLIFDVHDVPGPIGLLRGEASEKVKKIVASIISRYSDGEDVEVSCGDEKIKARDIGEEELKELRV